MTKTPPMTIFFLEGVVDNSGGGGGFFSNRQKKFSDEWVGKIKLFVKKNLDCKKITTQTKFALLIRSLKKLVWMAHEFFLGKKTCFCFGFSREKKTAGEREILKLFPQKKGSFGVKPCQISIPLF